MVTLTTSLDGLDWAELAQVIARAPLGSRDIPTLRRAFEGSYLCVFAWEDDRLIGAGRAISDGIQNSTIYDLVVLPELQGRGVGRLIMEALLEGLPKKSVLLVSVPGKEGFYEKLGFRRLKTSMIYMLDPSHWQDGGYFMP